MRHPSSTKRQHLRKTTMKQTANVSKYAGCAVAPRVRNAGIWPMFITASDNLAPHYATFGGTNRVFHRQKERVMTNLIAALMCVVCSVVGISSAFVLLFSQQPVVWLLALGGLLFAWLFASMIEETPEVERGE